MAQKIPPLQVLCLRRVGPHDCNAEKTFCPLKNGTPSTASRLLYSFHKRPVVPPNTSSAADSTSDSNTKIDSLDKIPLARMPLAGKNASRRAHANDVDINCPFVACRYNEQSSGSGNSNYYDDNEQPQQQPLVIQYGNCALDCLQGYIDSLSEQGRMDDTRLGKHFFREWRRACLGLSEGTTKRKRGGTPPPPLILGSLSLRNCAISDRTIKGMLDAKIGQHLGVLDMTGMHGLNDDLLGMLLRPCCNLERLSVKNCRRLTSTSLEHIVRSCPKLTALDVGGCVNSRPEDVLDILAPSKRHLDSLVNLNASGLGWTDSTLATLAEMREWEGLCVGFSMGVTSSGLRNSLTDVVAQSLTKLAIPFCEAAVDNSLLGYVGKVFIHVTVLDIRGNASVNNLTPWFDGRTAARTESSDEGEDDLFVLARYTSINKASIEETKRIHPLYAQGLTCILDGEGAGGGIRH